MKRSEIKIGKKVVEQEKYLALNRSQIFANRGSGTIIDGPFKSKKGGGIVVKVAWDNGQSTEISISRILEKEKHDYAENRTKALVEIRQAIEGLNYLGISDNIAHCVEICAAFCNAAFNQVSQCKVSNPDASYCLESAISRISAIAAIEPTQSQRTNKIICSLNKALKLLERI